MKKKLRYLIVIIVIIFVSAIFYAANSNNPLSEAEIREKFRCNRPTEELLATDIYCKYPQNYNQHLEEGAVINPGDFDDPRYEALFTQ